MHRLFALLAFVTHSLAAEIPLESRRLHLGRAGSWEWDEFKDRKVDAEHLEVRFFAEPNLKEQTLRIWQRQVKLNWPVILNGKKLGSLTQAETAMETLLAIPPGTLKTGENTLVIESPPNLDDIEIGPVFLFPDSTKSHLSEAQIEIMVTDHMTGSPLPCRLTLTRPDGTLQPLLAAPAEDVATRVGVVYARDGSAVLSAPPGEYELHAGRGFEWSLAMQKISLQSGRHPPVHLKLKREVDTRGWIAADSHIHTLTHSGHGDARIEERMLTIAGEGIELAIATDHNHHTDYLPFAKNAGLASAFTAVIGNEVTTKHGHFNAFPIQMGAPVVNHQEENWAKLLPAIRATPGVKVITLNHPRDLHSGFVPLGGLQFNPRTGKHRDAAAFDIDAMEVITSAAMQTDVHLLYRDWFALLNRGHRIAAIASSDSHDVNRFILGQGRTYVAASDVDPSGLDLDSIWRSYREGRLLVSLGLLAQMRVNDRFTVGDLVTGVQKPLKVEIEVSGPAWVQADRVELHANGILIREKTLHDDHQAGIKARVVFEIPKPAHDVHLVAIATGPGITAPFWEIPRPYQPSSQTFTSRVIGSTNPIWIDADGDGQFQSAHAIARALVERHGKDTSALKAALLKHDESVSIQAASL